MFKTLASKTGVFNQGGSKPVFFPKNTGTLETKLFFNPGGVFYIKNGFRKTRFKQRRVFETAFLSTLL